jgi:hypothetical protein
MRVTQNVLIGLALALLSVPALGAQDLSHYRAFSLGSTLGEVAKHANATPDQVQTLYRSPALIQQLALWPIAAGDAEAGSETVQQMQLNFSNGVLYRIVVIYRTAATQGFTNEDMIAAISPSYGLATRPLVDAKLPPSFGFGNSDAPIASWQDAQYSVVLSRSALSQSFQLVVLSKSLQEQADAAIAAAVAQNLADAPQREDARVKKEAQDIESLREANLKAFRP